MFQKGKYYNFANNRVIVGAITVGGYDDEGGITYELASEVESDTVGADGEVTISHMNDDRVYVTLQLKETSKSYKELAALQKAQTAARRLPTNVPTLLNYLHFDPNTGDKINSSEAIFMNRATISKAKLAGMREFRILLPYGARTLVHGALLT